jgi:hypothetical protein
MNEILKKRKTHLEQLFIEKRSLIEKELKEIDKIYKELIGLNKQLEESEQNNGK